MRWVVVLLAGCAAPALPAAEVIADGAGAAALAADGTLYWQDHGVQGLAPDGTRFAIPADVTGAQLVAGTDGVVFASDAWCPIATLVRRDGTVTRVRTATCFNTVLGEDAGRIVAGVDDGAGTAVGAVDVTTGSAFAWRTLGERMIAGAPVVAGPREVAVLVVDAYGEATPALVELGALPKVTEVAAHVHAPRAIAARTGGVYWADVDAVYGADDDTNGVLARAGGVTAMACAGSAVWAATDQPALVEIRGGTTTTYPIEWPVDQMFARGRELVLRSGTTLLTQPLP